jgi:outer membrane usher protein
VRRDLGTDSGDYGQRFASGLYRYGVNKRFTAEGRAEAGAHTQGGGLGLTAALPWQLLGQAAIAVSNNRTAGRGSMWLAGVEHNSLRHGFSARIEGASQNYRYVGQDTLASVSRRQYSASYTYLSERWGNIGLGFARIDTYDRGSITTYSLNYSVRVGERSSLTFNAVHVNGATSGNLVGVNLTIPLEGNITTSSNVSMRDGELDAYTGATKGLGAETGVGWRTLAGVRQREAYAEGGVYYQGGQGLLTADLNASKSQQTLRVGAQGGLVVADGQFFISRRVDDAFALVDVPGYAGVGVGFQGSVLTRTDAKGKALLPRLIAYQPNSVRLDPSELPISAELDSIEQVVVPGSRNAVRVAFPVRSGRGALVRIVFDDGEPAPAGAELELVGDKQEFFVARRGEAFITGLQPANTVRLRHNGQTCPLNIVLPPGKLDEIARIGPLVCAGVKR